jgi:hypothetical protein
MPTSLFVWPKSSVLANDASRTQRINALLAEQPRRTLAACFQPHLVLTKHIDIG